MSLKTVVQASLKRIVENVSITISVPPKVISANYFTYIPQKTAEYVSYAQ